LLQEKWNTSTDAKVAQGIQLGLQIAAPGLL
jgi:hypothetical protein